MRAEMYDNHLWLKTEAEKGFIDFLNIDVISLSSGRHGMWLLKNPKWVAKLVIGATLVGPVPLLRSAKYLASEGGR